jgi:hypothetical protein
MSTDQTLTRDLLGLERKYWDAIKQNDGDAATSLSDHRCLVVGAQGITDLDREALSRMMGEPSWTLSAFDLTDARVRRISDDVAVVVYEVKEKLVVEGDDVALKAYDSSVWVRRDDGWVCALHTETPAGDPFGRRGTAD